MTDKLKPKNRMQIENDTFIPSKSNFGANNLNPVKRTIQNLIENLHQETENDAFLETNWIDKFKVK